MADLIERSRNDQLSLAIFKPAQFVDFKAKPVPEDKRVEYQAKMEKIMAERKQLDILDDGPKEINLVNQPDYNFFYIFKDIKGKQSKMQIEDWEIQALYRNCLSPNDSSPESRAQAAEKVRKKYWDDLALTKDLHLFLGTTLEYHGTAPNPFTIIGMFYPQKEGDSHQDELF